MFSEIAPTYDLLNGIMSLSLHHAWREECVRIIGLREGESALDLCCGTGDFLKPLRAAVGPKGLLLGADFALPMLEVAGQKPTPADLFLGDACRLAVRTNAVDAVTVGWGIRNVPEPDLAHQEIYRILKPGGRFVSVDMAQPRNPFVRRVSRILFNTLVPWLGSLFGKTKAYTYLPKSTSRFMTRLELKDSMERAGFADVKYRDFFFGNICAHWGVKR